MDVFWTIVVFFIVLFIVIVVHEFGHFIIAKKSKVRVDEFAVGFPPRLFSKKYKGTQYSLNALPLGGYVKLYGENDENIKEKDSFESASVWNRLFITLGGPLFNILLTILAFFIVFMIGTNAILNDTNAKYIENVGVQLIDYTEESVLEENIPIGSRINYLIINGDKTEVTSIDQMKSILEAYSGDAVVGYKFGDDNEITTQVKDGILGAYFVESGTLKYPIHKAAYYAVERTVVFFGIVVVAIIDLIGNAFVGEADLSQLSGPVGIANLAGDAASLGISSYITFIGILSLNLAILNLFPVPALDGGRAVFLIYEILTRRRVNKNLDKILTYIGFGLLIILIIFVTYRDIVSIFE